MLSRDLQRHTDLHRTLGFKFRTQHALLRLFVAYAESFRDEFVDSGRVIDWAAQAPSAAQRRNRLLTVRRFALALRAEDARHEAPSADVFGCSGPRRRKPHIYAPEEVTRLLAAAGRLGPATSFRASTYETLFGLLAATGMRLKVRPSQLAVEQLDVPLVLAFLEHVEAERGCSARTRNARLAAVHSFFRFLEYRVPSCLEQARQVGAIPTKKTDQALVRHLDRDEVRALLDAPDPRSAAGLRDRAMLHLAFAAGLRVSELVGLRLDQFERGPAPCIHVMGKGRRERVLPLRKETAAAITAWLRARAPDGDPELFLNAAGRAMTRSGFEYILAKHVAVAAGRQPSIAGKRVTPHVLRHSCAMHTLQATGDVRKVALWLGHASLQSTEIYLRANPTEKLEALATMAPLGLRRGRFQAPDTLMAMLKGARRS